MEDFSDHTLDWLSAERASQLLLHLSNPPVGLGIFSDTVLAGDLVANDRMQHVDC